jgi:hypothetical protein
MLIQVEKILRWQELRDKEEVRRKEVFPSIAKSQQDSITILLGVRGHEVGKVREGEEDFTVELESLPNICPPHTRSRNLPSISIRCQIQHSRYLVR